jgi:hypothetical protein
MPAWVRLGGRTELASGDVVVWSVADGRLGRRWRESTSRGGSIVRTILVETGPAGGIGRLEIATDAGLLTIHPDGPETRLHGNVVSPNGMRHLELSWGPGRAILVDGSPALTAIALGSVGHEVEPGQGRRIPTVRIDHRLVPVAAELKLSRVDDRSWQLAGSAFGPAAIVASLDDNGLLELPARTVWPLER